MYCGGGVLIPENGRHSQTHVNCRSFVADGVRLEGRHPDESARLLEFVNNLNVKAHLEAEAANQSAKRQKLEEEAEKIKQWKLLTRAYKAIRATATATLAISHTDDAGQDEDNTGYKPQEAGGEPQVDAGVADGSADVGCRRQQEADVQNDLDENEPPRMLRWF